MAQPGSQTLKLLVSHSLSKHYFSGAYCSAGFRVNGKKIPQVDFDAGDSWAGLLPISSDPNETRKVCWCAYVQYPNDAKICPQLFFWYFPPTAKGNENDLIFW